MGIRQPEDLADTPDLTDKVYKELAKIIFVSQNEKTFGDIDSGEEIYDFAEKYGINSDDPIVRIYAVKDDGNFMELRSQIDK